VVICEIQSHHLVEVMKPYLEHIAASKDGSWTLFDRRLPAIPFEWHYNSEYELTLTLNSQGQRFVGIIWLPMTMATWF
jgi:hypothetical protein